MLTTDCDLAFRASAARATSAKALGSVTALTTALAVESLTPLLSTSRPTTTIPLTPV